VVDEARDHDAVAVRFECVTTLPIPPVAAFDLSLSVAAHLASMARSREKAIGHDTSDALQLDDQITWRAWHFGIRWRLTTRITRSTGQGGSQTTRFEDRSTDSIPSIYLNR
jgi:hypothetical protein